MLEIPRWRIPNYYNLAFDMCENFPRSRLAMVWDDDSGAVEQINWGALQDLSAIYARHLVAAGLRPGDRVATVLRQSPETAAMMLGALRAGGVLVTMSDLWGDEQIALRVAEVEPRVLVVESRLVERFEHIDVPTTLVLDRIDTAGAPRFSTVQLPADSPAFIAYTSGTTGPAKGVVIPHRSMLATEELSVVQDLQPGELFFGIGDWSWWVRKLLGPWKHGAINLVYRYDRFEPDKFLSTLVRHGVTNTFINATALRILMRDLDSPSRFRNAFRIVTSSNEALGATTHNWVLDHFGVPPLEFYGSTEVGIMMGASAYLPVKPGSLGMPLPGSTVRILDEDGRELPPGEAGEISLLSGCNPNYPLGYWKRPDDSERDFGGTWYRTKDQAYVDEDGYFFYVGRRDDVIKASGYKIAPHEVEAVITRHPAVRDAALIGVPSAERGITLIAYVVLSRPVQDLEALRSEIQDLVRRDHSRFAYPRDIRVVEELPRSASGKTDRSFLRRQQLTNGQAGPNDSTPSRREPRQ